MSQEGEQTVEQLNQFLDSLMQKFDKLVEKYSSITTNTGSNISEQNQVPQLPKETLVDVQPPQPQEQSMTEQVQNQPIEQVRPDQVQPEQPLEQRSEIEVQPTAEQLALSAEQIVTEPQQPVLEPFLDQAVPEQVGGTDILEIPDDEDEFQ